MDHSVPPQRHSPESDRSAERMRTTPDAEKAPILVADRTMAREQENEVVYYRRATAHRELGQFDEIDRAIEGVGLWHEQSVQERRAIVLARDDQIQRSAAVTTPLQVDRKIAAASSVPKERPRPPRMAQKIISPGLLKMTEILGLFIALVGFVAASGTVVVTAKDFEQRAPATVLLIIGTLIFFGLLRLMGRRRARQMVDRTLSMICVRFSFRWFR